MYRRLIAVSVSAILALLTAPTTAFASCGETTKFVQQVAGTNLYYGNRGSVYNYDHRPMCSVNAHSTFLRASDDYRNFVEVGVREDPDGSAHIWTEWRVWPNAAVVNYWDQYFGTDPLNAWYVFEIVNGGAGQFGLFWAPGNDPDNAAWQYITNSDAMTRNVGEVESEEARFGTANANHHAQRLETENRQYQGWGAWFNLQCDQSQNFITTWWAVKYSNQHWQTVPSPPGIC